MLSSRFLLGALASVSLSGLVGCVDGGDEVMIILQNQAPTTGCIVSATVSDPHSSSGVIDTRSGDTLLQRGYVFTPLLENKSTKVDGVPDGQRTVIIQGAHVDIEFADTALFTAAELTTLHDMALTHFNARFGGSIPPEGVASFGFESVPGELLPFIKAKLSPTVTGGPTHTLLITKVQAYGTFGGGAVTSQVFEYPIDVCDGCLVNNVGACDMLSTSFMAAPGGACNVFQDGVVDCCSVGADLSCPAVGTGTGV